MRWNGTTGRSLGVIIASASGGEAHARPDQSTSAQNVINEQLVDDCDFGVALFWSRLGTRTASAESGSAEEIARLKAQDKSVLVYFKTANIPQPIDTQEYDRLNVYRQGLTGLNGRFANPDELRGRLHGDLTTLASELLGRQAALGPQPPPASTNPGLALLDRIPPAMRHNVTVRWFAYRDHNSRDKYAYAAFAIRAVDEGGNVVQLESRAHGQRVARVPISAIQEVWSDAPDHWSVRIAGSLDMDNLNYSP